MRKLCQGFLLVCCIGSLVVQTVWAEEPLPGEPDEAWDAVFTRTEGWSGADGAYSLDLGDSRTLWLFSDSWVGGIAEGKHAPGSKMVNNTIAAHPTPANGEAPDFDSIKFYWGRQDDADGNPAAWITPDAKRVEPSHTKSSDGVAQPTWFWLADGIVAPGPGGEPRLLLFLWHVGRTPDDQGVWSFRSVGGALAVVDNPHEPVESWNVAQFDIPHTIDSERVADDATLREMNWGSEVMLAPAAGDAPYDEAHLYVYGVKETSGWNKQLVLARAPAARCEDFSTWRFRAAEGWSPRPEDAAPLADGVANEFSIEPLPNTESTEYVMIHSEPVFGTRIMARAAKSPLGPWTEPVPVYDVPDVKRHETYFTYAAKGHASLARPGELLITYVINSHDFWKMASDAAIYRPKFVGVPARREKEL